MKTYINDSLYAQEFSVEAALRVDDDGRFVYDESWSSYGAAIGGRAKGVWWRYDGALFFRCDERDGALCFEWTAGETKKATEGDETIAFDYFEMRSKLDEPVRIVEPPKRDEAPAPPAEPRREPLPSVARLHFNDGRILERPLAAGPPAGLFTETYYRLVDESGESTNLFRSRPPTKNSDPRVIDYDEI